MVAPEFNEPIFFGMESLAQFSLLPFEVNVMDYTSGGVGRFSVCRLFNDG